RGDHQRAADILHLPLTTPSGAIAAVEVLPLPALESVEWKVLEGMERHHTPHSDFFSAIFVAEAADVVVAAADSEKAWDDTEFLISIEAGHLRLGRTKQNGMWFWAPPGRFLWRRDSRLDERMASLASLTSDSPELRAGLLGGTVEEAAETLTAATEFFKQVRQRMY